jgi:hypothetical protein
MPIKQLNDSGKVVFLPMLGNRQVVNFLPM